MAIKQRFARSLLNLGFDPRPLMWRLREYPRVRHDFRTFNSQRQRSQYAAQFPFGTSYRIYGEKRQAAGGASGHYFHQDLLVAREVHRQNPVRHIDVASRIDGFVAHVASFRRIEVIDIRPLDPISGIDFIQADLMNLDEDLLSAADSVSCLHALEHFGLGRYGDPINFDGWELGLQGLTKLVAPGGRLYLSVPTGHQQRVEFNAHRVFSLPFIRTAVSEDFDIEKCSFVKDDGNLYEDIEVFSQDAEQSFFAEYGCSIWTLRRRVDV